MLEKYHSLWVQLLGANAFNSNVSCINFMFHVMMFHWKWHCSTPIICSYFYVLKPFFYNSHCNQKGQLSIIPLTITMGTHKGDPFCKPLFVWFHLQAFHSITTQFLSCLFFIIVNEIHIKDFPSVLITFEFLIL